MQTALSATVGGVIGARDAMLEQQAAALENMLQRAVDGLDVNVRVAEALAAIAREDGITEAVLVQQTDKPLSRLRALSAGRFNGSFVTGAAPPISGSNHCPPT